MAMTQDSATTVTAYAYDRNDRLTSETTDGDTVIYIHDIAHWLTRQVAPDGTRTDHAYNLAGQALRTTVTSPGGSVVSVSHTVHDGQDTNPYRYNRQYYDTESGYIYLRMRYYDPSIGRFVSADPYWNTRNMQRNIVAMLQSANLYVYALNNPLRFADPKGLHVIQHTDDEAGGQTTVPKQVGSRMLVERLSAENVDLIDSIFMVGTIMNVLDIRSGIVFSMTYYAPSGYGVTRHVDLRPTPGGGEESNMEKFRRSVGGKWSWDGRPVLVTVDVDGVTRTFSGALRSQFHYASGDVIVIDENTGHVCLHFMDTQTKNGTCGPVLIQVEREAFYYGTQSRTCKILGNYISTPA